MQPSSFVIKAGPRALARLRAEGLRADRFRVMVGASGGPKWFILSGLDRYIAGEFLKDRAKPMYLLGSSVGAWRMAAHAAADPVRAITEFRDRYHHMRYATKAPAREVSRASRELIASFLGESGAREICANPVLKLHIVTAGCGPLLAPEHRLLQMPGLLLAAGANAMGRRLLAGFCGRSLFHVAGSDAPFLAARDFPTERIPLTADNLPQVLEATGAIPLVLEGVRDIAGSRYRVHRDGGIVDYHFDLPFASDPEDLVLYPHFYSHTIPGWFDKGLPWRRPRAEHYDNVVLIAPSPALVASLPGGRISDRKDFVRMDDDSRIRFWQQVIDAGERIADEFDRRLARQQWEDVLEPWSAGKPAA